MNFRIVFASVTLLAMLPIVARADLFTDHMKMMASAIVNDDASRVRRLLTTPYVSIDDTIENVPGHAGHSYLTLAANHCSEKVVAELLRAGAVVDNPGKKQGTPALFAAMNGGSRCLNILTELLKKGADPNSVGFTYIRGATVLQNVAYRCMEPEKVAILRTYGGNVNLMPTTFPRSALHLVAIGPSGSAIPEPCIATTRALVDSSLPGSPDFTSVDRQGLTAITLAKMNCNPSGWQETNPRHAAVRNEIVSLYLAAGSPPPAIPPGARCIRGF